MRRLRLPIFLAAILSSGPAAHAGVTPSSSDFVVNSFTTDSQRVPDVSGLPGGGFVVAWESDHTGAGSNDIIARTFNAGGVALHADFRVNGYAHGLQLAPSVAGTPSGTYVVAWTDAERDLIAGRILRRRNGVTPDFDVTFDDSPYLVRGPDTAVLADGSFVVVWNGFENGLPFAANAVLLRDFDPAGVANGQTRRITELNPGTQAVPSVARLNTHEVLVTWLDEQTVFAKRYDSAVNTFGANVTVADEVVFGGFPSAAASANGNVFRSLKSDLGIRPIYHRLENRVDAHILIAFLAYCLQVTLKNRLQIHAPGLTPTAVLEKLGTIQMIDVWIPTRDARWLILPRYTQPAKDLQLLLEQIQLKLPSQPPPRITASTLPAAANPLATQPRLW